MINYNLVAKGTVHLLVNRHLKVHKQNLTADFLLFCIVTAAAQQHL